MTNGQIAQILDLAKCHLVKLDDRFHFEWFWYTSKAYRLDKQDKAILRRLTHQYRNQIAAMRRNRKAAG